MKKETNKKTQTEEFKRFDELLRNVVKVSKDEILRREKAEKESKKKKGVRA